MVQGIVTPHSPQNRPSSETQRNWPHRSHFLGSSGSFRQTIGPPSAPQRYRGSIEECGRRGARVAGGKSGDPLRRTT